MDLKILCTPNTDHYKLSISIFVWKLASNCEIFNVHVCLFLCQSHTLHTDLYSPFQVDSASEGCEMGVVRGSRVTDRSGTSREEVTQVVRQLLQVILWDVQVIPQLVIFSRSARSLMNKKSVIYPCVNPRLFQFNFLGTEKVQ